MVNVAIECPHCGRDVTLAVSSNDYATDEHGVRVVAFRASHTIHRCSPTVAVQPYLPVNVPSVSSDIERHQPDIVDEIRANIHDSIKRSQS